MNLGDRMIERRSDHLTRKRVSEMSPEEMRTALLVSAKTGLPNRRAFDEGETTAFVAMIDANGLKALNDTCGYSAGDVLICRLADVLHQVGLDAYHDKGDEFLTKGKSYQDLKGKLSEALRLLERQPFAVSALNGRVTTIEGADFCFGIGTNLEEAEKSLKHQKELRKVANETDLSFDLKNRAKREGE
jgi:GGDEF domain-containing protein